MQDDDDKSLAAWAAQGAQDDSPTPIPEPVVIVPEPPGAAIPDPPTAIVPDVPADDPSPDAIVTEPQPAPAASKKPTPLPAWMRERLAEQTARQREAERQTSEALARAQVAEAELATLRARAANQDAPPAAEPARPDAARPPDGFVPASEVDALAEKKAEDRAFNAQADAAYFAGKEAYPDFEDALQPLAALGVISRRDFQEAALATDAAPDVIYYLGCNPNEASKILADLKAGRTAKAAAEMTKISVKISAQKATEKKAAILKPSAAPAPIRPVGGSAIPATDLEKLGDDDFTIEFDKKASAKGWW